ncbi:MAG: hypothetical protein IPJ88_00750 [Myxococcales bacterium]|nr:MAG: hypothetical protein IPJ88_00750 [Myxococcales bacterium]
MHFSSQLKENSPYLTWTLCTLLSACTVDTASVDGQNQAYEPSIPGIGFCDPDVQDIVKEELLSFNPYWYGALSDRLEEQHLVNHGEHSNPYYNTTEYYSLKDDSGLFARGHFKTLDIYLDTPRGLPMPSIVAYGFVRFTYETIEGNDLALRYVEVFKNPQDSAPYRCGNTCDALEAEVSTIKEVQGPYPGVGKTSSFSILNGANDTDVLRVSFSNGVSEVYGGKKLRVQLKGIDAAQVEKLELSNFSCESGNPSRTTCKGSSESTEDGGCQVLPSPENDSLLIEARLACKEDLFKTDGQITLSVTSSSELDECINYGILID